MKESVKISSGTLKCSCDGGGSDNAHIDKGAITTDSVELWFWFECGHKRRDIYRFHKGTTYYETQHFLNDREWNFSVPTFDFWDPETRQKAYEEDQARILAKVAAAEAKVVEAKDGNSI